MSTTKKPTPKVVATGKIKPELKEGPKGLMLVLRVKQ